MNESDELQVQIERLGGQLVGVQAVVDAMIVAALSSDAFSGTALRTFLKSCNETLTMNPNLTENEMAGASVFINSALETIDRFEIAADRGADQ